MRRKQRQNNSLRDKLLSTIKVLLCGILLYAGCAMLFLGSGIGHSYVVRQNAQYASKTLTIKKADKNKKAKTSYDATKTKSIDAQELWRARQYPASAIGRMSIPVVNIHNPLFAGYGSHNQNLSYGVVTVVQGRTMGGPNNYVLAGHYMGNYGPAILDNLHYMKSGDIIYVTDMHRIYAYQATKMSYSIKPNQVEVENNEKGKSTITLITCSDFDISKYGYGQHRTVVQGTLIGSVPATKSNMEKTELTDKDNQASTIVTPAKKTKTINPVTKKVITVRTPARTKVYQNVSFNQIAATFTIIWSVVMVIILIKIWIPHRDPEVEE